MQTTKSVDSPLKLQTTTIKYSNLSFSRQGRASCWLNLAWRLLIGTSEPANWNMKLYVVLGSQIEANLIQENSVQGFFNVSLLNWGILFWDLKASSFNKLSGNAYILESNWQRTKVSEPETAVQKSQNCVWNNTAVLRMQ